jgi:hypothetical protein
MTRTSACVADSELHPSDGSADERPAVISLLGALQGTSWYHQRADGSRDRELGAYVSRARTKKRA